MLLSRQVVVVLAVLAGDGGLRFQALHLRPEFKANILDTRQILAGIGDTAFGFLAPFLVLGHTGSFFKEHAQLIGLGLDDARNRSLPDDRVGARPEAGTEEQVGDVLAADVQVVDVILGLPGTRQQALDRQFCVLRPLAGDAAQRVVENQLDSGTRHRFARSRAVEDHILHRFAAQFRGF